MDVVRGRKRRDRDDENREVRIDRENSYEQKLCMGEQLTEVVAPPLDGKNEDPQLPRNLPHRCYNSSKT